MFGWQWFGFESSQRDSDENRGKAGVAGVGEVEAGPAGLLVAEMPEAAVKSAVVLHQTAAGSRLALSKKKEKRKKQMVVVLVVVVVVLVLVVVLVIRYAVIARGWSRETPSPPSLS